MISRDAASSASGNASTVITRSDGTTNCGTTEFASVTCSVPPELSSIGIEASPRVAPLSITESVHRASLAANGTLNASRSVPSSAVAPRTSSAPACRRSPGSENACIPVCGLLRSRLRVRVALREGKRARSSFSTKSSAPAAPV